MSALWIARVLGCDPRSEAIRFVITDGAEQRQIDLQRTDNAELYDFIVAHASEDSGG